MVLESSWLLFEVILTVVYLLWRMCNVSFDPETDLCYSRSSFILQPVATCILSLNSICRSHSCFHCLLFAYLFLIFLVSYILYLCIYSFSLSYLPTFLLTYLFLSHLLSLQLVTYLFIYVITYLPV